MIGLTAYLSKPQRAMCVGAQYWSKRPSSWSCCLRCFAAAGFFFANRIPSSFLPDEDQGYAYVNVQLPNGASLERTTAVTADSGKNPDEYAGGRIRYLLRRLQPAQFCSHQLQLHLFCDLQALGRAHHKSRAISIAQGTSEPAVEQVARGGCLRFFPARHSGCGHCWRLYLHPRRPFGQRSSVPRQKPGHFS